MKHSIAHSTILPSLHRASSPCRPARGARHSGRSSPRPAMTPIPVHVLPAVPLVRGSADADELRRRGHRHRLRRLRSGHDCAVGVDHRRARCVRGNKRVHRQRRDHYGGRQPRATVGAYDQRPGRRHRRSTSSKARSSRSITARCPTSTCTVSTCRRRIRRGSSPIRLSTAMRSTASSPRRARARSIACGPKTISTWAYSSTRHRTFSFAR